MTKPSSAKRHSSGKKSSKFSLLWRKLTLKKKSSPALHIHKEDVISQEIVVQEKKTQLLQRTSPMKLTRLYPKMTEDQVNLIKQAGYNGLVSIKCSKLQPDLCKYLMRCFNPNTCELVFPGRGKIPVTESSVFEVIGVPRGDLDVRYEIDPEAVKFMNERMGNRSNKHPSIASLEQKLTVMNKADNNYLRLFLTYSLCSVLAPNTCTFVSPRLYPSMVDIKQAYRLNMCKFVISMLVKAARSKSGQGVFKSCMFYFMVKYLDSLELEDMDISNEGTRVSVWTNAMVREAISKDQRSDGTFGLASLKAEFRCDMPLSDKFVQNNSEDVPPPDVPPPDVPPPDVNHPDTPPCGNEQDIHGETVLFSDPDVINRFLHMNIPPDCSPQDIVTYRETISEACHGFEMGLKNLITKLSHIPRQKKRKSKRKKQSVKRRTKKENVQEVPIPDFDCESAEGSDDGYVCADDIAAGEKALEIETTDDFIILEHRNPLRTVQAPVAADSTTGIKGVDSVSDEAMTRVDQVQDSSSNIAKIPDSTLDLDVKTSKAHESTELSEIANIKEQPDERTAQMDGNTFRSLLDFVRTEPACKDTLPPNFIELEPPTILDIGLARAQRSELLHSSTAMLEESTDGVQSMIQVLPREELDKMAANMIKNYIPAGRGTTTSDVHIQKKADSPAKTLPSPSTYRTRSAVREEQNASLIKDMPRNDSPLSAKSKKKTESPSKNIVDTPQKLTRSSAAKLRNATEQVQMNTSAPKATTPTVPRSATMDSMNRKLMFDSTESDKMQRVANAPDAPSFDLGFETQKDIEGNVNSEIKAQSVQDETATKIGDKVQRTSSPGEPGASITPVANEYQKRVLRNAKVHRSPYIDYSTKKSFAVSKPVNELYSLVCNHTSKSTSETKDGKVIDIGSFFVHLKDLADSVSPGNRLVNLVCEIGIHVINRENNNPKKKIYPLRMATYLIDCRFVLKEVKTSFAFDVNNRLDHKELLCFPTLQSGHYFLVNLNIKARRFEIMDSITNKNGEPVNMDACHLLNASIKKMWAKGYSASSVVISNYPIEVIPCPQQTNGYDCGFFML